jgi:two-component system, OmpR family, phosphate regulon sensor histidine kinase PhoR
MFWRLFLTYLLLVAVTVAVVSGLLLYRTIDSPWSLAFEIAAVGLVIVTLSLLPAYFFARRFTQPLEDLTQGTERLRRGDFSDRIRPTGGREFRTLASTFNDMSDQIAENFADLQHDKDQLQTILSGMVEGVVAIDQDQVILFANDRAATMLEFSADTAVGRKLWEVTRQRAVQDLVQKGLSGGGPYREQIDLNGTSDTHLAVYVSTLPGTGRPGAVLVIHDVSEIHRLERLRQDFVANVSHELKTPLANIKSSIETLLDGAAEEPGPRAMFLEEIDLQANRLDALVMDLLVLARIESGEATMRFEVVAVEDAVHACLDRHRTRAEGKGMTLDGVALAGCPQDLSVWADDEALAQILDNLVDNAIKYTPSGGRVTVRWQTSDQMVCLEVEDSGIGIPLADLPRIFERFYRVDRARSREMGGTGLGLAIVKHMVQTMKGTIRVSSEASKGTTFRVCLPRAQK